MKFTKYLDPMTTEIVLCKNLHFFQNFLIILNVAVNILSDLVRL